MATKPGTAKQIRSEQQEQTQQALQTAVGRLLLLQVGIAKGSDNKPAQIKLDADTSEVIASVVKDINTALRVMTEQSQSKAKAKAKPDQKQSQKPSRLPRQKTASLYNKHNQEWSKE